MKTDAAARSMVFPPRGTARLLRTAQGRYRPRSSPGNPLPGRSARVYHPVRSRGGLIAMWPFKRAGRSAAVIDPCLGDGTARRLDEAAGRGDWSTVSAV